MSANRTAGSALVFSDAAGVARHSMRGIAAAYRQARCQAQVMSTLRLRWRARRAQRSTDWEDQRDVARLAAMRDELRDRGVEVGSL